MSQGNPFTAVVSWPSAPLTNRLVRASLNALKHSPNILDFLPERSASPQNFLQWSTYDDLDHDITFPHPSKFRVLSSSYTIRKALIRKHYLSRCTHNHIVKYPNSILRHSIPRTWELEISFVDELDEMWSDELWDLGEKLEKKDDKWFILKPGMADRGMGIRLFQSKGQLEDIFQEFEDKESDDEEEDDSENHNRGTAVATSQLRHFVIQEYLSDPLLLSPSEIPLSAKTSDASHLRGHKFHLRAYCVASGALSLFLYTRVLALFSAVPYTHPSTEADSSGANSASIDLAAHLTNTSLQIENGEAGVRLLDELIGCSIFGDVKSEGQIASQASLTIADIEDIKQQMTEVLGETFKAALGMSVHFQPVPNAFELFGIDFLVVHAENPTPSRKFHVSLLEVNSEPAIELTGPRLTWILEELFVSIGKVCVVPFFDRGSPILDKWLVGETKEHLRKCLEVEVRGSGGW